MKRMESQTFRCTLISDCVINRSAATEGQLDCLDYIPGSNFLGVVARQYESFGAQAFAVFHGGSVIFGDAHPVIADERALRVPFDWFEKKGEKERGDWVERRVGRLISATEREELRKNEVQLKQVRSGWIAHDGEKYLQGEHYPRFVLKSAQDSAKRRAADGALFGYWSLPAGSIWEFEVQSPDAELLAVVGKHLVGQRKIGRSSSAQFGLVTIEAVQNTKRRGVHGSNEDATLVIYAASMLAFYDECGHPTLRPRVQDLGLPEGAEILWRHCQVRSRSYSPWNGKRSARDPERVAVEKGSIFVARVPHGFSAGDYAAAAAAGIGSHRSEGFGQIIVNPDFLAHAQVQCKRGQALAQSKRIRPSGQDLALESWLRGRMRQQSVQELVEKRLADEKWLAKFSVRGPSPSQWGQVRSIAETSTAKLQEALFAPNVKSEREYMKGGPRIEKRGGFLMHGKKEWPPAQREALSAALKHFEKELGDRGSRVALAKLAAEMAKLAASRSTSSQNQRENGSRPKS
jgi:hypothetical protein